MPNDPFETLGLPTRFDLEPGAIEQAYLGLVALDHPDLVSGDDEAVARSAKLNDARMALLNPEQRARALLGVLGFTAKDDSLPDGFLFEIMDVRSRLEQATHEQNAEELENLQQWAGEQRQGYIARIQTLFAELTEADQAGRDDTASKIRESLNAWRYIERMLEQAGQDSA